MGEGTHIYASSIKYTHKQMNKHTHKKKGISVNSQLPCFMKYIKIKNENELSIQKYFDKYYWSVILLEPILGM